MYIQKYLRPLRTKNVAFLDKYCFFWNGKGIILKFSVEPYPGKRQSSSRTASTTTNGAFWAPICTNDAWRSHAGATKASS